MGKEDETEVSRRDVSLNYTSGKTELNGHTWEIDCVHCKLETMRIKTRGG